MDIQLPGIETATQALETLGEGGWPMIPLAACSLIAVTIIVERAVALRRRAIIDADIVRAIDAYAGESSAQHLLGLCGRAGGPLARIVEEVLDIRHLGPAQIPETVYAAGRIQVSRLERGLTLLEIIAGVSPLIGLLGTVLGMLTVFNAISAEGIGDPQVLSQGISKALITTIAGLCVGIPALAFHSWFTKRVDDLAAEMQGHTTRLIVKLNGQDLQQTPDGAWGRGNQSAGGTPTSS